MTTYDPAHAATDAPQDFITILWHIDDVWMIRPDLSNAQARAVLRHVEEHHDAKPA